MGVVPGTLDQLRATESRGQGGDDRLALGLRRDPVRIERALHDEHRAGDVGEPRTGVGRAGPAHRPQGFHAARHGVGAWDNHDVTELQRVPPRLLVLGGGAVGVEMAQAIRRLGAEQVVIVTDSDRLLPREEPFVGDELADALEAEGIELRLGLRAVSAARSAGGPVTLQLDDSSVVEGDELLVAVGRQARTMGLGLESVGVAPDAGGYLSVDDDLRVAGHDWLFAIGDVNGRVLLTHHGTYQGRLVGERLAGVASATAWADDRAAVRVFFTDPQVAAVGLTSDQAARRGIPTRVVRADVAGTAAATQNGLTTSSTGQLVLDADRDVIIGATLVGPGVGELLHAATVAIVGEVALDRLWHAVPGFPTMSEVWLRLLEQAR